MFRKILLPTDGSAYSAEAARFAGDLASHHDGTVQPMVAVEYQYLRVEDLPKEVVSVIHQRIEKRAQAALDQANQLIAAAGAKTEGGKIVEAPPVNAILAQAIDGEYDLIVMGSRGVSLEQGHERLIGSVTERVLHRTPCPVLVIRAPGNVKGV